MLRMPNPSHSFGANRGCEASEPRLPHHGASRPCGIVLTAARHAVLAGLALSSGCLDMRDASTGTQPDGEADTAPVVGRLQMHDRTVDLTVHAFADTPGAIPTRSYARVMADCQVRDHAANGGSDRDHHANPDGPWNTLKNTSLRP